MTIKSQIQGLINQVEQGSLSSIDYEKEEALLALDLIQIGNTFLEDLFQLQNKATDEL